VTDRRPDLPLPLMREVRRRCGFGCVVCGKPIYEYDHLLGWANTQEHVANEITLLCIEHHGEKTRGFLTNDAVTAANEEPYNLREGVTKPYDLRFEGTEYKIVLGNTVVSGDDQGYGTICQVIRIDGYPVLGVILGDGHFLLSITLFDECNRIVMQIVNNELVVNLLAWDVEIIGTRLILRSGLGKILLDIRFDLPNTLVIERGRFLRNGVELLVAPKWAAVLNNRMVFQRMQIHNCGSGLVLGEDLAPPGGAIRISGIPRYGWDRIGAISWARSQVATSPAAEAAVADLTEPQ
jgi:hypothetical protein